MEKPKSVSLLNKKININRNSINFIFKNEFILEALSELRVETSAKCIIQVNSLGISISVIFIYLKFIQVKSRLSRNIWH